jgi:hypothetical protein
MGAAGVFPFERRRRARSPPEESGDLRSGDRLIHSGTKSGFCETQTMRHPQAGGFSGMSVVFDALADTLPRRIVVRSAMAGESAVWRRYGGKAFVSAPPQSCPGAAGLLE